MEAEQFANSRKEAACKGVSGVYQIRCIIDGRIYIGSSIDIPSRWQQHVRSLDRQDHSNYNLQWAWNQYGASSFEFTILEYVDKGFLLEVEQIWMDKTKCFDRGIGFNISDKAGSPGGAFAQIWEGFINPEGNEITIENLHAFCRDHKLDFPSMHRLSVGASKLKSYKGWSHRNSIRKREYIKTHEGFIDPEGNLVEPIVNLAEFCRVHDLDDTHMLAVARGKICSHRGWTHVNGRKRRDICTYYGFHNPKGELVVITNLLQFCRDHNLHPVKMHQLKGGKIRQYKGWTWEEQHHDSSQEP